MKALFTYNYGTENMKRIAELGYDITIVDEKAISNTDEVDSADVLVCYNPFDSLDIRKMKNLKWIQLSSIGIDQLPIDRIRGEIIVTNNRGGYSIPMGEWIVMKILEMMKNSRGLYRNQDKRIWKMDTSLLELYGKKVGFIGTGSIAVEAAKRLRGFEAEILGVNTSGKTVQYFDRCFSLKEIDMMLGLCDVVVVTLPYTKETHHLINEKKINLMKTGVLLVNVSRGSVIDEEALIRNIESKKVKGAALDVFEEEPLPSESPLWGYENVIVSPHNSWISEKRNERRFELIFENMRRYINNEALMNIVDLKKGY